VLSPLGPVRSGRGAHSPTSSPGEPGARVVACNPADPEARAALPARPATGRSRPHRSRPALLASAPVPRSADTSQQKTRPGQDGTSTRSRRRLSFPGPRPSRPAHRFLRHGPGQHRCPGTENPAPKSRRQRPCRTVRSDRPDRPNRPDADLRRTLPAAGPGPVRGPLQRTATPPQPPAPAARPDHPAADLCQEQIKRRAVPGGLLHEYGRTA